MDRRNFVQLGVVAGALALRGKPLAAVTVVDRAAPSSGDGPNPFNTAPFELEEATVADLQAGMASGRYTARSITQMYLSRISELDRQGPRLRHVIETNTDALSI